MSRFRLEPEQKLDLAVGADYYRLEALEHPTARGMVHSMEGGKAFVYHLRERAQPSQVAAEYALKVMRTRFVDPGLAAVCQRLEVFHTWDGLRVCKRVCLSPAEAVSTLRALPDLSFSMLMPWIAGFSWLEVMSLQRDFLSPPAALELATRLALILCRLEDGSMAHCDLSSANLILDPVDRSPQLIDVEDLFGPGFSPPNAIPLGTPGYQHRESAHGQWGAHADRFAGAILLSEILAWHSKALRAARYGESFFDPGEMQNPASGRFRVLAAAVADLRPGARTLLERAWGSKGFADCPTLREWASALEGISWEPFPTLALRPPKPVVTWGPGEPLPVAQAKEEPVRWEKHVSPPPPGETRQIFEWTPHASASVSPAPQASPLKENDRNAANKQHS